MIEVNQLFTFVYADKKSDKVFLLLHGTGGDEKDLIPIAEIIEPNYSILSLRGNIQEHGMNRFFERYEDGTFNKVSIEKETAKLHEFLDLWLKENNKKWNDIIFLSYSNGANFALSFMMRYSDRIKEALLLHPTVPQQSVEDLNLEGTKILVTSGLHDPYLNAEQKIVLKEILGKTKTTVTFYQHKGGHELREEELKHAEQFLQ